MFFKLMILVSFPCLMAGCLNMKPPRSSQEQLGYDYILALQNKDTVVFEQLFSEEHIKQFKKIGLQDVLNKNNSIFVGKYGDFKIEDFQFNYQGSETKGKLYFFYKGERAGNKVMLKIKDKWVFESI